MNFHPSARQQTRRVLFGPKRTFALLFCTSLTAVPAFAQQENGGGSEQLVEIVVTAQRREQNLQDTPVAVSAFGGQELQSRGVSSVQELGQVDSSLNIPAAAGVYLPFLRGIGNDAAGSVGNESSVPVYIDDVYYTRLSTAYLALGDIDRVNCGMSSREPSTSNSRPWSFSLILNFDPPLRHEKLAMATAPTDAIRHPS